MQVTFLDFWQLSRELEPINCDLNDYIRTPDSGHRGDYPTIVFPVILSKMLTGASSG